MTAEVPVDTFINTSKDLMSHLSQHALQSGIDSYVRFACVGRGGSGFSNIELSNSSRRILPKEEQEETI